MRRRPAKPFLTMRRRTRVRQLVQRVPAPKPRLTVVLPTLDDPLVSRRLPIRTALPEQVLAAQKRLWTKRLVPVAEPAQVPSACR